MSTKTKPRSPPEMVRWAGMKNLPLPTTIIGVLAVIRRPPDDWGSPSTNEARWRIIYRPTGLSVACCRTKKDAISLATDLQELADWSQVEENGRPRLELSKIVCPYLRGDPRSC